MSNVKVIKTPMVKKALEISQEGFRGHWRMDGRPTYKHILDCLDVSVHSPHKFTEEETASMVMHDIEEDTPMTYKELVAIFNRRVAYLVHALSKPKDMDTITYYEFLREVMSPTVIAMKLCDVVANLESLEGCDHEWAEEFKFKITNYGFPLLDVIRVQGDEWHTHADYIQPRMEDVLGPKPIIIMQ